METGDWRLEQDYENLTLTGSLCSFVAFAYDCNKVHLPERTDVQYKCITGTNVLTFKIV